MITRRMSIRLAALFVPLFGLTAPAARGVCADDVPAKTKALNVEVTRDIAYSRPDGVELKLDAYVPAGDGPFPAVLVVHGGAWRIGTKLQLAVHAHKFAERGMAAFAISYRLAPHHKFPAQIHDCKAAIRWIRSHARDYRVDPNRIGAYGYSAGGHLVALLGVTNRADRLEGEADGESAKLSLRNPNSSGPQLVGGEPIDTRVQCVVAGGAPCDFQLIPGDVRMLAYWLGGTRNELPDIYRSASPIAHVRKDHPPMLFFHGSRDELVNIRDVERMVQALKAAGCEAELKVLDGANHITAAISPAGSDHAAEFLLKHLKTQNGSGR